MITSGAALLLLSMATWRILRLLRKRVRLQLRCQERMTLAMSVFAAVALGLYCFGRDRLVFRGVDFFAELPLTAANPYAWPIARGAAVVIVGLAFLSLAESVYSGLRTRGGGS